MIKELVRLRERKGERADREFLVEGAREISRALACSFEVVAVIACQELLSDDAREILRQLNDVSHYWVASAAFAKVAVRESSDGMIAVFRSRSLPLGDLSQVLTENNIEIGRAYYRYCLNPDDSLTNQDSMIQAIANAVWTPSVISAYKETLTVPQG